MTCAGFGYQALSFALRKSKIKVLYLGDNEDPAAFIADLRTLSILTL